ncbi:MAG: aspartate-semialdehyde dehydrogenase [Clostridiales bacterium]|jgi:aspartate-semialdehyde dehydrogenase|nr:aspartate-semialdehyde dehydrogenase [Clostridiales bacterium]
MKGVNVGIVGATGMVGRAFLEVLSERKLPIDNYYFFSSARSAGKRIQFLGKEYTLIELDEYIVDYKLDIALFSAGAKVSLQYAPLLAKNNCVVIDNSSAFRMDKDVPLVVPEVNAGEVKKHNGIIANPNCSTIQAVVALKPIEDKYRIKRIVYSTYQAVSGAGMKGYTELENSLKGGAPVNFPHPIANNCLPHIDVFTESGYTKEEIKMVEETRKILNRPDLAITATTVRVPVFDCHSESINIEFEKDFDLTELIETLREAPSIIVQNNHMGSEYPLATNAKGHDEVYVGRIRRDMSVKYGINMWVVADNIRKGAATNAVQIAESVLEEYFRG